jgi:hypothetical protein
VYPPSIFRPPLTSLSTEASSSVPGRTSDLGRTFDSSRNPDFLIFPSHIEGRMSQDQNGLRSGTVYIHPSRHLHVDFMSQLRQPSVVFLGRKLSISSFLELLHHTYDAVEKMADAPGSGIKLTIRALPNCLPCAQGKQTRINQPHKDTWRNAPVDMIGGVICSDIKGPMVPKDRNGTRYLVNFNFIDRSSNSVRVFLAKNKVEATKRFEDFLTFSKKQDKCRVHVLRMDGGGEYKNVEGFC